MLNSVEAALTSAEPHDVTLAFEPEHNNVVNSATAGRRLLDEMRSPHLKVVIDPVNLLDGPGLEHQADTLGEAFDALGDDLVLAHAKDLRADGTIAPAGRGRLDYARYLHLLTGAAPAIPLILHGLPEDQVPNSVTFLRETLAQSQTR